MEIVKAENLTFTYPKCLKPVFKDVTFSLEKGGFLLITGKSGAGKSTLLRLLKKEIAPNGKTEGRLDLKDGLRIGYVSQNPYSQTVSETVAGEMAFGLENIGLGRNEMRRRIAETADFFGLSCKLDQKTDALSGGETQILNLASVTAMRPELLVLDEPAALLDPTAAARFYDLLRRLNKKFGIAVIIAAHDTDEIEDLATNVLPLREAETRDTVKPETVVNNGETALKIKNLYFAYGKRERDILKDLSLTLKKGRITVIAGGNGSGKTTLLSCIAGIKKPYSGKINVYGAKVGYLPQNPALLFVKDSLMSDLNDYANLLKLDAGVIDGYLDRFGLQYIKERHPLDLSGGELERAALIKILFKNPDLLLLDEPSKGLDASSKFDVTEMLFELKKDGKTILAVTHDMDFARSAADECCMLGLGALSKPEPADRFFEGNFFYR